MGIRVELGTTYPLLHASNLLNGLDKTETGDDANEEMDYGILVGFRAGMLRLVFQRIR
ncbi:hypothetical protein PAT3040_00915 [Paenibacillus agaridevorans]|uniref:Uncharacterized protein n=1 Tax=Paenibacillus agaridevorans TaxID=171404 RepID=A0A2R5EIG6_9BACL|nr:hypothetical protein PAT3040_00915 [Paenibacillus agaridevorans]